MEKEYVEYDESLGLQEIGFNIPCFAYYITDESINVNKKLFRFRGVEEDLRRKNSSFKNLPNMVCAPLYQQAFRWFREEYNMLATVYSNASGFLYECHDSIGGTHRGWSDYNGPNDSGVWDTYEEAELECLKKLIEIVKEKK